MADKEKGKYVPIYLDWLDVTQDLTAEEKGNLIDAVVAYAAGKDIDSFLSGGAKIAFRFMKGQVDRNKEISEARSKARSNKQEQTETNENKPEQKSTKSPKEKEKEKDKDKEKENKSVFVPPAVDEVSAYCTERNNGIDPEYFIAYYENREWKLSNGRKMKDWKLAIVTWEKNGFNKTRSAPGKTVPAQNYGQRPYEDEDEAARRRMFAGVV